jgi:dGTPase
VHDLVEASERAGDIVQGERIGEAMSQLRKFMFDNVYFGSAARREQQRVRQVIHVLFDHYVENPDSLPVLDPGADTDVATRVTDYLAGMTDRFCIREFERLTVPRAFT